MNKTMRPRQIDWSRRGPRVTLDPMRIIPFLSEIADAFTPPVKRCAACGCTCKAGAPVRPVVRMAELANPISGESTWYVRRPDGKLEAYAGIGMGWVDAAWHPAHVLHAGGTPQIGDYLIIVHAPSPFIGAGGKPDDNRAHAAVRPLVQAFKRSNPGTLLAMLWNMPGDVCPVGDAEEIPADRMPDGAWGFMRKDSCDAARVPEHARIGMPPGVIQAFRTDRIARMTEAQRANAAELPPAAAPVEPPPRPFAARPEGYSEPGSYSWTSIDSDGPCQPDPSSRTLLASPS